MSAQPSNVGEVRIPSGKHTGRALEGLAGNLEGNRWLLWALLQSDWPPYFLEALEEYAREFAPLVWRRSCPEWRGRS
jgi:hypothetical protein